MLWAMDDEIISRGVAWRDVQRKAALFAHLSAMLCSDFETWQTAHLLARMAAEGYGVAAATSPIGGMIAPGSGFGGRKPKGVPVIDGVEGGEGGWVVLQKHLLQWLLAVSARCGDAKASSAYFAGLARLMATLEEERSKADSECVCVFVSASKRV